MMKTSAPIFVEHLKPYNILINLHNQFVECNMQGEYLNAQLGHLTTNENTQRGYSSLIG